MKTHRPKTIRAVKSNPGIRAKYRRQLERLIDEMQRSVIWWVRAEYRKNEDRIARDASPARSLRNLLKRLTAYWASRWDAEADRIARDFIESVDKKTRSSYVQAFKAAGVSIKMKRTRVLNDTVAALIEENVSLIKTIPSRYFGEIEELVQRSIADGRDIAALEDEIKARYEVTRKRARVIATDQTEKATNAVKRAEDKRLGITEGIWVHVPGRKQARATHMAMHGKRFNIEEGLYDSAVGRCVKPGELIQCRCTYREIIPELGEE